MSDWSQYTRDAQSQSLNGGMGGGGLTPYSTIPYSPNADRSGSYDYTTDPASLYSMQKMWGFDQALNAGQIQAGPQFALNQNSRESLAQQIALMQASQSSQSGFLNQDYQTGLAKLGLSQQGMDVQRGALGRQPAYLSTLHDLTNQSLQQSADQSRRSLDSSATARGAFTSIGANEGRDDISTQLANQLSRSDTQYNEQVASLADQNKMLDIQGQSLGLDRQSLKTELERGLDRLGLNTSMSLAQLTEKMNSSSIEDQILAQQIFNAALQSSDYYAQQYPMPTSGVNSSAPGNAPPIQTSTPQDKTQVRGVQ